MERGDDATTVAVARQLVTAVEPGPEAVVRRGGSSCRTRPAELASLLGRGATW